MKPITIGFVGAGGINFGQPPHPWDHASRLETIGGIRVVAIVDIDTEKARAVLKKRQSSAAYEMYRNCQVLSNWRDLLLLKPDAVLIGILPIYRGSFENGNDLELSFVRSGINVFVEKPVSLVPPTKFLNYVRAVENTARDMGVVVSVGYMFRYHAAIKKMKDLILSHGGKVMAFNARYYFAYTETKSGYNFRQELNGGPILELATHFYDLARYIAGEVDEDTVSCILLESSDRSGAGNIRYIPKEFEDVIPQEQRIPRVCTSQWRFQNSGIGTLTLSIVLPGYRYETGIDVHLDGMSLSLTDIYETKCTLRVRRIDMADPNISEEFTFEEDDCYLSEMENFYKAIKNKDQSLIKSSYGDAAKTYALTWVVNERGQENVCNKLGTTHYERVNHHSM